MLRAYYLLLACVVCFGGAVVYQVSSPIPFQHSENPQVMIDLWPEGPPGPAMDVGEEVDVTKDTDDLIAGRRIIKLTNVKSPQAHVYLPPAEKRNGSVCIVCPGGGFNILAWDLEGTEVAEWLNSLGVTAVVLKYRVPTRNQDPMWLASTQDAQRTVSIVRANAEKWQIDAKRVALMGFSAGGFATVKTCLAKERHYAPVDDRDTNSCKPDRGILIYSAGLPDDAKQETFDDFGVDKNTPPMFIAHTFDDFVPVQGTANMLLALKSAGVPSELHVYDAGGHGYGLRQVDKLPVTTWTTPCEAWLRRAGWLTK